MKKNIIKLLRRQRSLVLLTTLSLLTACADITERQREYLDLGETNYVGKMDSIIVHGGKERVEILSKNTYLRTASKCVIKWVDIEGTAKEKIFDIKESIDGDYTRMVIDPLPEGEYDFYIYTMDDFGNRSLTVECFGTAYGERYIQTQPKIAITNLVMDDDGNAELTLSKSKMAVKYKVSYKDVDGVTQEIVTKNINGKLLLPRWEDKDKAQLDIVTYVLPTDKLGIDTLELPALVQTAKQKFDIYQVDKSKIEPMALTKHDDDGKSFGAKGVIGLFDNDGGECWGKDYSAPGHLCFDLGRKTLLTSASIIGRDGYPGWDVVKFELWGRESISDGPDGETGYYINAKSSDANFVEEATTRGWEKVGNGWFKYEKPRKNPQTSSCELTEVNHSFKARYILLRIMSVLTPNVVPVPNDNYFGEEGGFYVGDGVNNNNRAFCIRELTLKANGISYVIE